MVSVSLLLYLCCLIGLAASSHFRGGIIQWRPLNASQFDGRIEITHRIAWRRSWYYCTQSTIDSRALIGSGTLSCQSGCSGSVGSMRFYCTDFSTTEDWSAGERSYIYDASGRTYFEASFRSCCWISLRSGGSSWEVRVKGNLTQRTDNGLINSSPISTITPIIRLQYGCSQTIVIPVADADGDIIRCRWAESLYGECAGVCRALPGATLSGCTLQYSATGNTGWYAVALQIEDFVSSTATVPLSSVPLQFLIHVFTSTSTCNRGPQFVAPTRVDGSCIGIPFNTTWHESIIAQSGAAGVSITEIVTVSPPGLMKSVLMATSSSTQWYVNVTWSPTVSQYGPHIFCYTAIDSHGLSSVKSCITLLVGVEAPLWIENSTSPTGQILPNHANWSIQFDKQFLRPTLSSYIRIYDQNGTEVIRLNAATSPDVIFPQNSQGRELTFQLNFIFTEKRSYYVLFDPGVAVGPAICGPGLESPAIQDPNFWVVTVGTSVPAPPTNLQVTFINSTSVTISWQAPPFDPTITIASYRLVVSETEFGLNDTVASSTTTSYTFTGLEEYNNYNCSIVAVSTYGVISNETVISFATPEGAPTAAPRSPSGTAISPTLITLTWTPPPTIDTNGEIRFYLVEVTEVITGRMFAFYAVDTFITIGPLHAGYLYHCRVAAFTVALGPYTAIFPVHSMETAPTGAPSNFVVNITTQNSVSLSWNPPPIDQQNGLIRYYVITCSTAGSSTVINWTSNTTELTIQNLQPYSQYSCTVAAFTIAIGPASIQLNFTLPEAAPSAPPQNLSGFAVDHTTISLSWSPPPVHLQNGNITRYEINITEQETGLVFGYGTTDTSIGISSLHPDYTYDCVVAAFTVALGPYSATISVRVLEAAPSSPPENFVALSIDPHSVNFTWDPLPLEDQNGLIVGYVINVTATATGEMFQLTSSTTTLSVTFLEPFTIYICTIAARTPVGIGPFSTAVVVMTPEDVPSEPQSVSVSTLLGFPMELLIRWLPPLELNGILIFYTTYCRVPHTASNVSSTGALSPMSVNSMVVSSNATEVRFLGLMPYTTYECFVTASTSVGESNFSSIVTARTDEAEPGDPPAHLAATVISATSVYLTWSDPLLPNGVLVSYNITYNLTGTYTSIVVNAVDTTSYTFVNLSAFTYYKFLISASTRVGAGPVATIVTRTNESTPSSSPRNVSFVIGTTSATISWFPPELNGQNGIIMYYVLELTDVGFNSTDAAINTTQTSHAFTNLEEYNVYSCVIAAATQVGLGPYSEPIWFTTREDVPTAPPTSISGMAGSSTMITLHWLPPPSQDINGVIRFYIVRLTERHTGRQWSFFALDQDIRIGSLHPYYLYDFVVAAYTTGTGPFSQVFTVQTAQDVPIAPPDEFSVVTIASDFLTLTWVPPPFEETNGVIQYYSIQVTELETGQLFNLRSNVTNITITDLHPYYTYQCSVAVYTISPGPYSDSLTIQLLEEAPSASPQNASGYAIDSESIFLQWSPPPFEHQNGLIRMYIINVTEVDTGAQFQYTSINTEHPVYSLHPYYTYEVVIRAATVAPGPPSIAFSVQTNQDAPSAPVKNPVQTGTTSTSISLEWEPPDVSDQNGVIIGYVINATVIDTGEVFQFSTTLTHLILDSLQPYTMYVCRIAARTSIGIGPYSIPVTVTTEPSAPSSAPEGLIVSATSSTSISLSWSPPLASNLNGIITEYRINITEVNTGRLLTRTSTTTSIIVQFLHPYYTYNCTVSAVTVAVGPYTEVFSITTPEDVPTSYPQNFTAIASSSHSATLTWDAPPMAQQNGIIILYTINVTVADSGEMFQLTSTTTSLTVSTLQPFTTYFCIIAASTSVGMGPFSTVVTLQTPEDVPTSAPTNPIGIATHARTIRLSWGEPPSNQQNGIIREYRVNITEVATGRVSQHVSTTTSIEITSLHPFYVYEWRVSAFTVGEGPYSSISTVTTLEDVPSGPPLMFNAMAQSSESIILVWEPPSPEDQNGLIVGYTINITDLETGERYQHLSTSTNITIGSLTPFTTYICIIAARTNIGIGPFSTMVTVQTLEDAPRSEPSNTTGTALNSTHIYLTWDPPPPEDINGVIREYRINVTEGETGLLLQYSTSPDTRELIVGPLHPYYTYHCTVVAYTVEAGPYTAIITVQTDEAAPSSPPSNFTADVIDSRSISLSWQPPALDQQNGILRHYIVTLESSTGTESRNISSSLLSITVSGLSPYVTYSCTVRAGTVAIGPPTAVILRTTLEDVPTGPPQQVTAQPSDATTLVIQWQPPLDIHRNGVIRRYIVNITELETSALFLYITTNLSITITSLHPFYRYSYIVSTETIGLGPYSDTRIIHMPEAAPSTPPTNIWISSVTSTQFLLSWSNPPLVNQNGVIRNYTINITEVNTGILIQITSQTTSELLESLHPYYNYSCVIAAVTVDTGPFSESVTITTLEDVPSGSPQNFVITADSSTSLSMSWDPPEIQHRNGIITAYTINITSEDGMSMTQMVFSGTSFRLELLRPFVSYTCSIAAHTSVGQGPFSTTVTATTPEDAPEAAPTMLTASNVSATSVTLSWEPPESDLQNGVIRHYLIQVFEYQTGNNLTYQTTAHTVFIVGDLHPFYTYSLSVQAVTVAAGPLSLSQTISTLEDVPSGLPENVTTIVTDSRTLVVMWTPPPEDLQNGIIVDYTVNITVTETGESFQHTTDGNTTLILTGLHPYYTYSITVAASTRIGIGPYTVMYFIRMPEDVPTSPPQNAGGLSVNSTFILLTWEPPVRDGRNGIITSYYIHVIEVPTSRTFTFERPTHTDLLIGSLHPYYDYQCSVAADTSVGRGPFTAPFIIRTDQDAPSGPPLNVTTRAVNSTTIEVTWAPPAPEDQNGIITLYSINVTVSATKSNFVLNTSRKILQVTGLHPHYTYLLVVSAVTIRPGPYSEPQAITTLEDYPTGVPQHFTAEAASSTSIVLRWEAPLADLQNGIIQSYNISVVELETGRVWLFTTNNVDRLLIVNLLLPFHNYNCTIAAYTIGPGPSISVSVQTPQEEPSDVPRDIVVQIVDARSVQLTWAPPPPQHWNGIIIGYVIRVIGVHTEEDYHLPLTNGTSMVIENLHPFYTYRFSIAAQTVAVGPFSNPLSLQMPEGAPSAGSVEQVTVDVVSATSVNVSWLPTSRDNWNGVITHYTVEYRLIRSVSNMSDVPGSGVAPTRYASIPALGQPLANNPNPTLVTSPLKRESVLITGLHEFSVYQFTIYYENSVGRSDISSPLEQATAAAEPSDVPRDVVVQAVDARSVQLTWAPPPPQHWNGIIIGYVIRVIGFNTEEDYRLPLTNGTSTVIEDLHPFYTYRFFVAAQTVAVGPFSNSTVLQMPEGAPSAGSVEQVTVNVVSATSVNVSWLPTSRDNWNGIITHYTVEYRLIRSVRDMNGVSGSGVAPTVPGSGVAPTMYASIPALGQPLANNPNPTLVTLPLKRESVLITGLQEFSVYQFSIYYENSVGRSDISSPLEQATAAAAPSGPPTDVVATALSATTVSVSWQPPALLDQNGVITAYQVVLADTMDGSRKMSSVSGDTLTLLFEGLDEYTTFNVSVAANNSLGIGPYSRPVEVMTQESKPSDVPRDIVVQVVDARSVQLTWVPPPPQHWNGIIIGYVIRVVGFHTEEDYRLPLTNSTSMVIEDLHPFYTYRFSIAAQTVAVGPFSNSTVLQMPEGAPSAGSVEQVTVDVLSSTSVNVSWFPTSQDNWNGVITHYTVEYRLIRSVSDMSDVPGSGITPTMYASIPSLGQPLANNPNPTLVTSPLKRESVLITGLHEFSVYQFSIYYENSVGRSDISSPLEQATAAAEPSDVPRDIVVQAVDARSVQLTWAPPPPQHWNGIIIGYVIRVIGVHTEEDYHLPLTNGTSMVIENLHPFYTYRFFVAAQTVAVGPFSNPIALQMPEAAPSAGSVELVTVDVVSSTSVNVSWLPTSRDNWNGIITHYTVEYRLIRSVRDMNGVSGSGVAPTVPGSGVAPAMYASIPALGQPLANNPNPTLVTIPLKRESVLITGLHEFSVYQFSIYYENSVGRSDINSPLEQATAAAAPSGPPTDVVATALSATTVSVSWQPPALLDQNGVITAYQVVLVDTMDGSRKMSSVARNTLTLLFEGLDEYTTFNVSVAANNSFGIGPYSQPVEVMTQESTPGQPTDLIGNTQNETSVLLQWSKPNDPNGIILGYQVLYYSYKANHTMNDQTIEHSLTVGPNTTSTVIIDLEPGLRYDFKVRARTGIGYGANSTSVAVTLFRAITHGTNSTAVTVTPDHTRTSIGYAANSTAITMTTDHTGTTAANSTAITVALDTQSGGMNDGTSGTTTAIVVAVVFFVLLVILVAIITAVIICRKYGKHRSVNFDIANRRETAESNIYGMAAGIQIVNPLALESEKELETELGGATVKPALEFNVLSVDKSNEDK